AGGGRAARYLPEVTAVLDASDRSYTISQSTSLEHARHVAAAAARRGETVVAFGGDGLTGALAGAVGAGSLGIIPAGQGNDFARALEIPFRPAAAARVLLDGRTRVVDLIAVTQAGETQVAPVIATGSVYIGIASVAAEIANRTRFVQGPLLYNLAALRALLGWKPTRFRIDAIGGDGQQTTDEFSGYAVVVANSPYFGAGMRVAPDAEIGDGLLDVLVMRHATKLAFLRVLTRIKKGSHVALSQVGMSRAAAAIVTADRALPAGADGEILTVESPWHIRAIPGALNVIVPGPG
ncbi:MAG: diacylglycerol/lipid kinase family protein, partial [Micromonosporaceae bacterium]